MVSQVPLCQLYSFHLPDISGELQVYLLQLEVQDYISIIDLSSQIPTNGWLSSEMENWFKQE